MRAGSVGTVTALWVSTVVDDFAVVSAEAARVLTPGGTLLVYGVHPCFNGPLVEGLDDGSRVIHPGYRDAGWHMSSPWWSSDGVRSRVRMRHVPLAELINAVAGVGSSHRPRDRAPRRGCAVHSRPTGSETVERPLETRRSRTFQLSHCRGFACALLCAVDRSPGAGPCVLVGNRIEPQTAPLPLDSLLVGLEHRPS